MVKEDMIGKLDFYFKELKRIHISCSGNIFYNGVIYLINNKKDFILFVDDKLGVVPIMFEEINRIEPFMEKK